MSEQQGDYQEGAGKSGGENATLRYEQGGAIQVVRFGDKEIRLPGSMQTPQIIEALKDA